MKKINNRGYIMTEALIISAIVLTALILIYAQFSRLNKSYNESYYFNSVNGLYALNQVATFLDDDGITNITNALTNYLDITDCRYATDVDYCKLLIDGTNIKYLLYTSNKPSVLMTSLVNNNPYDLRLQNFVKTLSAPSGVCSHMLVAEFYDGTYAAIPYNEFLCEYEATVTTYAATSSSSTYAASCSTYTCGYHTSGWGGACDSNCMAGTCYIYQSGYGLDGGWECDKSAECKSCSCPQGGSNNNGTCYVTNYSCNEGDRRENTTCYHYECPQGGTLDGTLCSG